MTTSQGAAVAAEPLSELSAQVADDTVILRNANTTIGYARFSASARSLDYIYVNPAFRRRGVGRRLVALSEERCKARLVPAAPLSPMGTAFFAAVGRAATGGAG